MVVLFVPLLFLTCDRKRGKSYLRKSWLERYLSHLYKDLLVRDKICPVVKGISKYPYSTPYHLFHSHKSTHPLIHPQHSKMILRDREVLRHDSGVPVLAVHRHGVCLRPERRALLGRQVVPQVGCLVFLHEAKVALRVVVHEEVW